jgi:pectin methylesterase-like acyl-CoA thioesterase
MKDILKTNTKLRSSFMVTYCSGMVDTIWGAIAIG